MYTAVQILSRIIAAVHVCSVCAALFCLCSCQTLFDEQDTQHEEHMKSVHEKTKKTKTKNINRDCIRGEENKMGGKQADRQHDICLKKMVEVQLLLLLISTKK